MKSVRSVKNILSIVILMIAAVLSLQGCRNVKETKAVEEQKTEKGEIKAAVRPAGYDFPAYYESQNENVIFKTHVIVPDEVNKKPLKRAKALLQRPDQRKAFEVLFDGIELEKKEDVVLGKVNSEDVNATNYIGMNEEGLTVQEDTCNLITPYYIDILRAFDTERNASEYSLDAEFAFSSKKNALKNILGMLEKMGIEFSEQPNYKCYALDHQTLQQQEYAIDMDGNEDKSEYKEAWTEADDSYYFVIRQNHCGLPVHTPLLDFMHKMTDENAPLQVLYTVGGIKYFNLGHFFTFSETEEEIQLKPFEDIAETINNKYGMLLSENSYLVKEAQLCYMTTKIDKNTYDLKLVWIVQIDEMQGDSVIKTMETCVDAETAEEKY